MIVAAFYKDREAALTVHSELLSAGFDHNTVQLFDRMKKSIWSNLVEALGKSAVLGIGPIPINFLDKEQERISSYFDDLTMFGVQETDASSICREAENVPHFVIIRLDDRSKIQKLEAVISNLSPDSMRTFSG